MDQLTTEMAEYFCDKLCVHPKVETNQKNLDKICDDCKVRKFICDILNTYNNLNDFEKSQNYKLLQELSELRKQLPVFKIGDTAYLVDFDKGIVEQSIVRGIITRTDKNETEFEYDSTLLEFHSDDIGLCVFRSDREAQEAINKKKDNKI